MLKCVNRALVPDLVAGSDHRAGADRFEPIAFAVALLAPVAVSPLTEPVGKDNHASGLQSQKLVYFSR